MEKMKAFINTLTNRTGDLLSKYKWPLSIFFATGLVLLALILAAHIRYINRQPWYTYGNAIWSNDSSELIYTRESIYPQGTENKKRSFEIRRIIIDTKEQNLVASLEASSSSIKMMKYSGDGKSIYFAEIRERRPEIYRCPVDGSEKPSKVEIPGKNIGNIIQDRDDFIFSEENRTREGFRTFSVSSYNATTGETTRLFSLNEFDDDKYKLTDGDVSPDRRYYGMAVWHQTNDNLDGFSSFWLYDANSKTMKKTPISSYGAGMTLEMSWNSDTVALKTIDISENGARKPLIHFYNLESGEYQNCFLNEDINLDFEIIWANNDKLFMKTDDKIYLIKRINKSMTAGVIFDKTSIPMTVDEFSPDPSGTRTVLIKYAQGMNLKSEILISNIDGTSFEKLIMPEGRRNLEGNPVYIYLRYCKLVIIDFMKVLGK